MVKIMSARRTSHRKGKTTKYLITTLLITVVAGASIWGLGIYLGWWAPFGPAGPPVKTASTFTIIDRASGEDVSDLCEIRIYEPDTDYDDDWSDEEDIYTLTNFESAKKDTADDISIDLRDDDYYWVEINPDEDLYWANTFYLISGGVNYDYTYYVDHLSSDVNINLLNRTDMEQFCLVDSGSTAATHQSGNWTFHLDIPIRTTSDAHYGDKWDTETDEFNELSAEDQADFYNERLWRTQGYQYVPGVDQEKEFDSALERLTNTFNIRITCNTSINVTDGASTQINVSLLDTSEKFEIVSHGQLIDIISTDIITFTIGPKVFDIEIEIASEICITNIQSGRIVVPRADDSLGPFTAYSSIIA